METTRVREMAFVKADGTECESIPDVGHVVLRLECRKTGKRWAMDLTGAQYDINEPLQDWSQYKSAHIKQLIGHYPLEHTLVQFRKYASVPGLAQFLNGLPFRAAAVLQKAVGT